MYENVPNMHGIIKRSSTDNSHDQAIKYAQTSKSSDQGQILDDQNLDPGRKRLDTLILGDPLGVFVQATTSLSEHYRTGPMPSQELSCANLSMPNQTLNPYVY